MIGWGCSLLSSDWFFDRLWWLKWFFTRELLLISCLRFHQSFVTFCFNVFSVAKVTLESLMSICMSIWNHPQPLWIKSISWSLRSWISQISELFWKYSPRISVLFATFKPFGMFIFLLLVFPPFVSGVSSFDYIQLCRRLLQTQTGDESCHCSINIFIWNVKYFCIWSIALCVWKAKFWSEKPRHFLMVMKVLWSS